MHPASWPVMDGFVLQLFSSPTYNCTFSPDITFSYNSNAAALSQAHISPSCSLFTPELQYDVSNTFHSVQTPLQNLPVRELKWDERGRGNVIWRVVYFCRNVGHPHPLRIENSSALTSALASLSQRRAAQIFDCGCLFCLKDKRHSRSFTLYQQILLLLLGG